MASSLEDSRPLPAGPALVAPAPLARRLSPLRRADNPKCSKQLHSSGVLTLDAVTQMTVRPHSVQKSQSSEPHNFCHSRMSCAVTPMAPVRPRSAQQSHSGLPHKNFCHSRKSCARRPRSATSRTTRRSSCTRRRSHPRRPSTARTLRTRCSNARSSTTTSRRRAPIHRSSGTLVHHSHSRASIQAGRQKAATSSASASSSANGRYLPPKRYSQASRVSRIPKSLASVLCFGAHTDDDESILSELLGDDVFSVERALRDDSLDGDLSSADVADDELAFDDVAAADAAELDDQVLVSFDGVLDDMYSGRCAADSGGDDDSVVDGCCLLSGVCSLLSVCATIGVRGMRRLSQSFVDLLSDTPGMFRSNDADEDVIAPVHSLGRDRRSATTDPLEQVTAAPWSIEHMAQSAEVTHTLTVLYDTHRVLLVSRVDFYDMVRFHDHDEGLIVPVHSVDHEQRSATAVPLELVVASPRTTDCVGRRDVVTHTLTAFYDAHRVLIVARADVTPLSAPRGDCGTLFSLSSCFMDDFEAVFGAAAREVGASPQGAAVEVVEHSGLADDDFVSNHSDSDSDSDSGDSDVADSDDADWGIGVVSSLADLLPVEDHHLVAARRAFASTNLQLEVDHRPLSRLDDDRRPVRVAHNFSRRPSTSKNAGAIVLAPVSIAASSATSSLAMSSASSPTLASRSCSSTIRHGHRGTSTTAAPPSHPPGLHLSAIETSASRSSGLGHAAPASSISMDAPEPRARTSGDGSGMGTASAIRQQSTNDGRSGAETSGASSGVGPAAALLAAPMGAHGPGTETPSVSSGMGTAVALISAPMDAHRPGVETLGLVSAPMATPRPSAETSGASSGMGTAAALLSAPASPQSTSSDDWSLAGETSGTSGRSESGLAAAPLPTSPGERPAAGETPGTSGRSEFGLAAAPLPTSPGEKPITGGASGTRSRRRGGLGPAAAPLDLETDAIASKLGGDLLTAENGDSLWDDHPLPHSTEDSTPPLPSPRPRTRRWRSVREVFLQEKCLEKVFLVFFFALLCWAPASTMLLLGALVVLAKFVEWRRARRAEQQRREKEKRYEAWMRGDLDTAADDTAADDTAADDTAAAAAGGGESKAREEEENAPWSVARAPSARQWKVVIDSPRPSAPAPKPPVPSAPAPTPPAPSPPTPSCRWNRLREHLAEQEADPIDSLFDEPVART